jgi:hypothetical protein
MQSVFSLECVRQAVFRATPLFPKPRKAVPHLPYGFACHRTPKYHGITLRMV